MKALLREMTEEEFQKFRRYSIDNYARELEKGDGDGVSPEEAAAQAEEEFLQMLPQGLNTENSALMIIEDSDSVDSVGIIWYIFECTDGVSHSFLCDLWVMEEKRRRGYASAALACMEADARNHNCRESRLYVWKYNLSGRKLYESCGYIPFRETDDGTYMKKAL